MDWRSVNGQNFITPVKDQKSCSASWAFATIGAVEAKFAIENEAGNIEKSIVGNVQNG